MYVVDLVVEAWIRVGGGGNIRKKIALDFLYSNNEVKFHIFCFPTHLQGSNIQIQPQRLKVLGTDTQWPNMC